MKKLYSFLGLLILIFTLNTAQAQVLIVEGFEESPQLSDYTGWNTALPPFSIVNSNPCEGLQSLRANGHSGATAIELSYLSQIATGLDIEVSFEYKLIDVGSGAPINNINFGQIDLSYTIDNGTTWTVYDTIDQSDLPTSDCSTHSFTIPAASVPAGSDFGWRMDIAWNAGDYYIYFDNFKAVEQVGCIPPVNITVDPNSIDFDGATITWDDLNTPPATSYTVTWCISPGAPDTGNPTCASPLGGSQIVNTNTIDLTGLFDGTAYYVYVQANCGTGDSIHAGPGASDPPTFSTLYIGTDCNAPIEVNADPQNPAPTDLPYTHTSQTDLYGFEEYSGSPGLGCGGNTGNILDGYEVVYHYVSDEDDILTIDVTGLTGTNVGVFVYQECADIGSLCIAGDSTTTGADLNINSLFVDQGEDYYIVIASSSSTFNPQNTNYTISIEGFDCATWNPPSAYANPALFVAGMQTLADFSGTGLGVNSTIVGANLTWYEDNNGAPGTEITVPLNTVALSDLGCFWVTQTIGSCESPALQLCFDEFNCATDLVGITNTTGDEVCESGSLTLSATAADPNNIYWYTSDTGGEPIYVGNTFNTPNHNQTTPYWVTEVFLGEGEIQHQGNPGPISQNISTNNGYGVTLDIQQPLSIVNVQVFAAGSGTLSIELHDGSGPIKTKAFSVSGGTSTSPAAHVLDLNWKIDNPGTYYLRKAAGPGLLYSPSSETNFPYALGTGGEITNGATSSGTSTNYYYFYNWTVTGPKVLCEKLPRTQVDAIVHDIIPTNVSADDMVVCLGGTTDLHVTSADQDYVYTWVGSDGSGPLTGPDVTVTVTQNTTYTVTAVNPITTCQYVNDISLEVKGAADLALTPDQELCNGESVQLTAGGLVYDFEENPTGWTTTNTSTSSANNQASANWQVVSSPHAPTGGISSKDNSRFYVARADLLGPNSNLSTQLISPIINMVGVGSASVSFEHFYRHITTQSTTAAVEVRVGNSSTWTTLQSFTSTVGQMDDFVSQTIDLSSYLGSTIQLRFNFTGGWGWYWAIDNVIVTRNFLSGSVTWSPMTDLYFDKETTIPYTGSPTNVVYFGASQQGTHTYTATLNIQNCSSSTEDIIVTVYETQPPTANANQDFEAGQTLANLNVTGQNLKWYIEDQNGDLDLISPNTTMIDETTYYVTQTLNGCESSPIAITVNLICYAPENVDVAVAFGSNTALLTVTWDPPTNIGGIQDYYIEVVDITDPNNPIVVHSDSVPIYMSFDIIDDLELNHDFEMTIYSVCDGVNGGFSTSETIPFNTDFAGTHDSSFEKLTYYPNPTRGQVYFENNTPIEKISIYGISGNKVMEVAVEDLRAQLDFSRLSSGTYIAVVQSGEATKVVRIIRE